MAEADRDVAGSEPAISVVLAVRDGGQRLDTTLDSVLGQSCRDFELVVVNDGSSDSRVASVLSQRADRDHRVRVVARAGVGLTSALIAGCDSARGGLIARIDNGDRMSSERLAKQREVMRRFPDCVLVASRTAFYGPRWEHLWDTSSEPMAEPVVALSADPTHGLAVPISHHGSVMFRKSMYLQAGGYRREFRLGQDWDLWYRLVERGTLFVIPETLYHARVFPDSISMSRAAAQRAFGALSLAAFSARRRGEDDASVLAAADALNASTAASPRRSSRSSCAAGYHFIGEALRRNRDRACRGYLETAVRLRPWSPRSWLRLLQSFLVTLEPVPSRPEP